MVESNNNQKDDVIKTDDRPKSPKNWRFGANPRSYEEN